MASEETTDKLQLQEFERLDSLLSQVPKKAQHGLIKTCDLVLTCIDANVKYIALGTNVGLTFLYSRVDGSIQRLKATNVTSVVTAIALHCGVDDLVATGTASGEITIYCIPGLVSVQKKQIQKFDVPDLHQYYITCLKWSTNGMKLYSGDKSGQVGVTDIDFYQGMSKSECVLIEGGTEVVQIDYLHRVLLVSTRHRTFVVRLDKNSEIIQIGNKERKISGPFGACFIPGLSKPEDVALYTSRPGCRVWVGNASGTVKSTLIFGEPLATPGVAEIPLLTAGRLQTQQESFQFGKLLWLSSKALVTWSPTALVVLDPVSNKCVARQSRLSGVVDVTVVPESEEIFLLRRHGDARVIRISTRPEHKPRGHSMSILVPPSLNTPMEEQQASNPEKEENKEEIIPGLSFFKKLKFPILSLKKEGQYDSENTQTLKKEDQDLVDNTPPPIVKLSSLDIEPLHVISSKGSPREENAYVTTPTAQPVIASLTDPLPKDVNKDPLTMNVAQASSAQDSPNESSIVFSHRMKKNRKKKAKEENLSQKEREADTDSQHSNELTTLPDIDTFTESYPDVQLAAEKAPTPSLETGIVSSINEHPSVQETQNADTSDLSTMEAIKKADEMLSIVNSLIMNKNVSLEPDTKVQDVYSTPNTINDDNYVLDTESYKSDENVCQSSLNDVMNCSRNVEDFHVKEETDLFTKQSEKGCDDEVNQTLIKKNSVETHEESDNMNQLQAANEEDGPSYENHKDTVCVAKDKDDDKVTADANNLLSEVDQHMTVISDKTHMATADTTETLDSAFARVSQSKVNTVEEDMSEKVNKHIYEGDSEEVRRHKVQRAPLVYQQSFQDIYCDVEAIEASNPFGGGGGGSLTESTSEDFYSVYADCSPTSPDYVTPKPVLLPPTSASDPSSDPPVSDREVISRMANSWSEFTAPANVYSLSISDHHVWLTDKSENIYYSLLHGSKGLVWRKATGYASQISVSPSGSIVWRLHKGVVYAGTKISTRHPEGLKWVEAVRDVQYIAVHDNCAWFIKRSGELMVQKGLSKERPCYRSRRVDCGPYSVKQVTIGAGGVVWAITDGLQLLVRSGVTDDISTGDAWEVCVRDHPPYLFSNVSIDHENIGWAIDVLGQIWFCMGVTPQSPQGDGKWWQVPMSRYVMQDESTLDVIRSMARKFDPTKLQSILNSNRGGLVSAGSQGVWLVVKCRNLLHVCRGSVQGHRWSEAQPPHMSSQTYWRNVCANISHLDWGLVWALHVNSDLVAFREGTDEAHVISDCKDVVCIAASPFAVWTVSSSGEIKIRTGMDRNCPHGTGWATLDLSQLGKAHFVHVSCNSIYVWAVELDGGVYQRIGTKPPNETNLNPVWLPIDTFAADLVFTKVFVGSYDWMVWGIDNRRLLYVRIGITESMPIGKEWMHVPGLQTMDVAVTRLGVWALTHEGEIFFRYGITEERPAGDYWKKMPGNMNKLSASDNDRLWGINCDGQLMQSNLKLIRRRQNSADQFPTQPLTRDMSINEDWEIV